MFIIYFTFFKKLESVTVTGCGRSCEILTRTAGLDDVLLQERRTDGGKVVVHRRVPHFILCGEKATTRRQYDTGLLVPLAAVMT
jgi:hypothetical protein